MRGPQEPDHCPRILAGAPAASTPAAGTARTVGLNLNTYRHFRLRTHGRAARTPGLFPRRRAPFNLTRLGTSSARPLGIRPSCGQDPTMPRGRPSTVSLIATPDSVTAAASSPPPSETRAAPRPCPEPPASQSSGRRSKLFAPPGPPVSHRLRRRTMTVFRQLGGEPPDAWERLVTPPGPARTSLTSKARVQSRGLEDTGLPGLGGRPAGRRRR